MKFVIQKVDYTDSNLVQKVLGRLYFLKRDYPNFFDWYTKKVVVGLMDDSRQIFVAYPANDRDAIAAVLILKNCSDERKISTLCVMEQYRSLGLGTALVELAINVLKTDRPVITVSNPHMEMFEGLFKKFGFEHYEEYPDYYRKGTSEHAYNGYLGQQNGKRFTKKAG